MFQRVTLVIVNALALLMLAFVFCLALFGCSTPAWSKITPGEAQANTTTSHTKLTIGRAPSPSSSVRLSIRKEPPCSVSDPVSSSSPPPASSPPSPDLSRLRLLRPPSPSSP